jgi:hypothetical protein
VIFRQPGCLSKTRRLSAPFLRMVEYYRLSLKQFLYYYHLHEGLSKYFFLPGSARQDHTGHENASYPDAGNGMTGANRLLSAG